MTSSDFQMAAAAIVVLALASVHFLAQAPQPAGFHKAGGTPATAQPATPIEQAETPSPVEERPSPPERPRNDRYGGER